jgi:hypothetical protein
VNLKNAMFALQEYFLVEHLWFCCYILNHQQIAPVDMSLIQDVNFFDHNSTKLKWFFEKPLGVLFSKTITLLHPDAKENITELREFLSLLRQYEPEISKEDIHLFEMSACNLGVRRVNKGNFAYLEIVFQIQKDRVDSGRVYLETGQIAATEFLSILINGLRLGELEWTKNFIETHKKRIVGVMPSIQYYEFGLANYFYHIKELQEARRILMTSDYADIQCRITARILEIKALFELSVEPKADYRLMDYLDDRVEAAILFFFRLKDVEVLKKRMGKRFADTMKRILAAQGRNDVKRLEKILQDIQSADAIAERQWLNSIVQGVIKNLT